MLGGMPARNAQSVSAVNAGNIFSIIKRFIKCMDYPAVDNLDVENLGFANSAPVGGLPSFIRMEYDGFYCNLAAFDRLDFDLNFTVIRICPIQSFHKRIITGKQHSAQVSFGKLGE